MMNYWQILDLWFKVKLYDLKSTVLFDLEACLHFCSVLDVCACVCVCVGGWVDGGGGGGGSQYHCKHVVSPPRSSQSL